MLLVQLHADSFSDTMTARTVKNNLAVLPQGLKDLDKTYDLALQRIESQGTGQCEKATKALCWVALAKPPLTPDELCCALSVEPGDVDFDPENVPDIQDIVSVFAGLLTVDYQSGRFATHSLYNTRILKPENTDMESISRERRRHHVYYLFVV